VYSFKYIIIKIPQYEIYISFKQYQYIITKMCFRTFLFLFRGTDSVKTSLILVSCKWYVNICYAVLLDKNLVHKFAIDNIILRCMLEKYAVEFLTGYCYPRM